VDAVRVTEVLADAFFLDPVWGWAFPDQDRRKAQHTVFWRFYVDASIAYGTAWITADGGAAATWIPPGRPEVPEEQEPLLDPMLLELVGAEQTALLNEVFDRFEAAHPADQPHYYLGLLGTHSDFRGRGLGMGLLAHTLNVIDAEGMPAYLESTNPANNERYRAHGFEQVGQFSLPSDGPDVTTMWRDARA
jgi:GNAT superfamily N-acetyltransferase